MIHRLLSFKDNRRGKRMERAEGKEKGIKDIKDKGRTEGSGRNDR